MKIEIFDSPVAKEPQPLRLKLRQRNERVELIAVDAQGEKLSSGGILLEINKNGIEVWPYVSDDVQLPRDDDDRIAVTLGDA
jgi:hypothetical protein